MNDKCMHSYTTQRGQSLIEILFAITVFTIGVVTIGYLIISGLNTLHYATESTQARLLASEGIEAVTAIRDGDFDQIPAGTYGLMLNEGRWMLASTSDTQGKFTRTITIEDIDVDTKDVISHVVWSVFGGSEKNITYTTRLSNWMQTNGDAGDLAVYTDSVTVMASSTIVSGLRLKNNGDTSIVVTNIRIVWDAPILLERITISGMDVFTASTSASVASGTDINITDYTLEAFSGFHAIDAIVFNGDLGSSNLVMLLTLLDGSIRSVYVTP